MCVLNEILRTEVSSHISIVWNDMYIHTYVIEEMINV